MCLSEVACYPSSSWDGLPAEMKMEVLRHMPLLKVLEQARISREWASLASDESMWRNLHSRVSRLIETPDALLMPTWKMQTLAYMATRDYLVTDRDTKKTIRYLPMRSASLPAIFIELGPDEARVFFHRPDFLVSLFQRLGKYPSAFVVGRDAFKMPTPPTTPDPRFEAPLTEGFGFDIGLPQAPIAEGRRSPFDPLVSLSYIELEKYDEYADGITYDQTTGSLSMDEVAADVPAAENRHKRAKEILEQTIVTFYKYTDAVPARAKYPEELERSLFLISPRHVNFRLSSVISSEGTTSLQFTYLPHTSLPNISRFVLVLFGPTGEDAKRYYEARGLDAQEHYSWRQGSSVEIGRLVFERPSLVFGQPPRGESEEYELVVGAHASALATPREDPFREHVLQLRTEIRALMTRDRMRPRLVPIGRPEPRVHEGDHEWPPCSIGLEFGFEPFVDISLPAAIDRMLNASMLDLYGAAIRSALERHWPTPLATEDRTSTPKIFFFSQPGNNPDEGTVYRFPRSNSYCLLDRPGGDAIVYKTEKGGPDGIAHRIG